MGISVWVCKHLYIGAKTTSTRWADWHEIESTCLYSAPVTAGLTVYHSLSPSDYRSAKGLSWIWGSHNEVYFASIRDRLRHCRNAMNMHDGQTEWVVNSEYIIIKLITRLWCAFHHKIQIKFYNYDDFCFGISFCKKSNFYCRQLRNFVDMSFSVKFVLLISTKTSTERMSTTALLFWGFHFIWCHQTRFWAPGAKV